MSTVCYCCAGKNFLPILDFSRWKNRIVNPGNPIIKYLIDIPIASASCPACGNNKDYYQSMLNKLIDYRKDDLLALCYIVLWKHANNHFDLNVEFEQFSPEGIFGLNFGSNMVFPDWLIETIKKNKDDIANGKTVTQLILTALKPITSEQVINEESGKRELEAIANKRRYNE